MADKTIVQSVSKGLDVLRLLGSRDKGMRLGEIASALGLKGPATHYLVRTMLAQGFLEKRGGNQLHIGPALLEIAAHQQTNALAVVAEKELLRLTNVLPAGVVLFGVATRQEMRQLYRISYDRPRVLQRCNGDLLHPYASASGLIGLAFASDTVRMLMEERHPFAEYGAHLWKTRDQIDTFLRGVRKDKVAVCPFEEDVFYRVAVPVIDRSRRLTSVVGASTAVIHLTSPNDKKRIIEELRASAQQLSVEPT